MEYHAKNFKLLASFLPLMGLIFSPLNITSHLWRRMKLIKQYTRWLLMQELILHLWAMVGFQRVFVLQLMSACVMAYLILVSYRFIDCGNNLFLVPLTFWPPIYSDNLSLAMQDGDIINIDVTVYLNVYSCPLLIVY